MSVGISMDEPVSCLPSGFTSEAGDNDFYFPDIKEVCLPETVKTSII